VVYYLHDGKNAEMNVLVTMDQLSVVMI